MSNRTAEILVNDNIPQGSLVFLASTRGSFVLYLEDTIERIKFTAAKDNDSPP